jgi:hypothetical protein
MMNSTQETPISVKICFFWIQVLSLYSLIFDNWPSELKSVFDVSSLFNVEIGYFGIGCDVKNNFYVLTIVKLSSPIVLFASFYFIKAFRLKSFANVSGLQVFAQILVVVNFLSVQLFQSMFQIFNCSQRASGDFALTADASELCYSSKWTQFVVVDVLFMFLYLIGIPGFLWAQYRKPEKRSEVDALIYRFTTTYKDECRYFECYRVLFKFLFVIIRDAFPATGLTKSLWLVCLLTVQQWLDARNHPYKQQFVNDIWML